MPSLEIWYCVPCEPARTGGAAGRPRKIGADEDKDPGVEERLLLVPAVPEHMEHRDASLIATIRHERTLRWFTASTISGKRLDQSLPRLVSSLIPTGPRRAISR